MRRLLLVAGILFVFASVAQGQTLNTCTVSPCPVQTNKAFVASADHDGVDTTQYRIYVNGAVAQTVPVSALQGGVIAFSVTLARGSYVLFIEALGDGGATAGLSLTVVSEPGKPKAPANFRIITTTSGD